MKKNLIFTGGIFHPFDETSKTLSKIINSFGYESEITIDIETGIKNINEFYLAGHSMGGRVVWDFTIDYPEKVSGLLIIGSAFL